MNPPYLFGLFKPAEVRRIHSKSQFYRNDHGTDEYNRNCADSLDQLLLTYIRGAIVITMSIGFAYICGFYTNYVNSKRATIFGFKFYGIADGSDLEYYINLLFECIYPLYFINGNIVIQMTVLLNENTMDVSTKIVALEMRRLSEDVESKRCTSMEAKNRLRSVLLSIQFVNKWIKEYDATFYWWYFLSPITFTYTIGLCIFAQYIVSFCLIKLTSSVENVKIYRIFSLYLSLFFFFVVEKIITSVRLSIWVWRCWSIVLSTLLPM